VTAHGVSLFLALRGEALLAQADGRLPAGTALSAASAAAGGPAAAPGPGGGQPYVAAPVESLVLAGVPRAPGGQGAAGEEEAGAGAARQGLGLDVAVALGLSLASALGLPGVDVRLWLPAPQAPAAAGAPPGGGVRATTLIEQLLLRPPPPLPARPAAVRPEAGAALWGVQGLPGALHYCSSTEVVLELLGPAVSALTRLEVLGAAPRQQGGRGGRGVQGTQGGGVRVQACPCAWRPTAQQLPAPRRPHAGRPAAAAAPLAASDLTLAFLARACPGLRALRVPGSPVTDEGLTALAAQEAVGGAAAACCTPGPGSGEQRTSGSGATGGSGGAHIGAEGNSSAPAAEGSGGGARAGGSSEQAPGGWRGIEIEELDVSGCGARQTRGRVALAGFARPGLTGGGGGGPLKRARQAGVTAAGLAAVAARWCGGSGGGGGGGGDGGGGGGGGGGNGGRRDGARAPPAPRLRSLAAVGCSADDAVAGLLSGLTRLELGGSPRLTDLGVLQVGAGPRRLFKRGLEGAFGAAGLGGMQRSGCSRSH
jgi:hypothetical protein